MSYDADGNFFATIMITAFAECERAIIRERVISGMEKAKARGVRISDATNSNINDISDTLFTISTLVIPTITVTSPMTGDNWIIGSEQVVTWSSINVTGYLNIWLSTDGGATYLIPLSLITDNDGVETITVPITQSTTAELKLSL